MNDPSATDGINQAMLDDIRAEFMELAAKGDRAIFEFALDYSEEFFDSAQEILMGLMTVTGSSSVEIGPWSVMAHTRLLNMLENEVAPEWVKTEYERRHQENVEMVEEWVI